jgi:Flp pilus assembly protein TadB
LAPVVDAINREEAGVDKTAAEFAMARLDREIREIQAQKARLLSESPTPGGFLLLAGIGGVVVGFFALACTISVGLRGGGNTGAAPVVVGIVFLVLGAALIFYSRWTAGEWNQRTSQQLKQLDRKIASKQAELDERRKTIAP